MSSPALFLTSRDRYEPSVLLHTVAALAWLGTANSPPTSRPTTTSSLDRVPFDLMRTHPSSVRRVVPTGPRTRKGRPGRGRRRRHGRRTHSHRTTPHNRRVGSAGGGGDLARERGRHVVVAGEGPGERTRAVGDRAQVDGVARQLVRRHLGVDDGASRQVGG